MVSIMGVKCGGDVRLDRDLVNDMSHVLHKKS